MTSIPKNNLKLVAVCLEAERVSGAGIPQVKFVSSIVEPAIWAGVVAPTTPVKCACCDKRLKYVCVVQYTPGGDILLLGRNCLENTCLASHKTALRHISKQLVWEKRDYFVEKNFLATASLEERDAYTWAASVKTPAIVADIARKVKRYGKLSPGQLQVLNKIRQEIGNPVVKGKAPLGRTVISGTVVSTKPVSNAWGTVTKVLVELHQGVRVYGNAPAAVKPIKGQLVKFTATFTISATDAAFGYWTKPIQWKELSQTNKSP
jgi:hypothetical protein